jgi:hypothetical protein
MASNRRLSIPSNASTSSLMAGSYPHLVIRNAFDPEIFAAMTLSASGSGPAAAKWATA